MMKRIISLLIFYLLLGLLICNQIPFNKAEYNIEGKAPYWEQKIGDKILSISISSNGELFTATNDKGDLFLFETGNNNELWKYDTDLDDIRATISKDGNYIVAYGNHDYTYDQYLIGFSTDSNRPLWKIPWDKNINDYSICDDGRFILVTEPYANSTLISGYTGDIIRNYRPDKATCEKSKISGNGEFIVLLNSDNVNSEFGSIFFFSTNSSELIWKDSVEGTFLKCDISNTGDNILLMGGSVTIPLGDGDIKYSGNFIIYGKDGSKNFIEGVNYASTSAITSYGDYILVGGLNQLYIVSNSSTNPIWSKDNEGYIDVLAISDNVELIVAGSDFGKLNVYTKEGVLLWNKTFGEYDNWGDRINGWYLGNVKVPSKADFILVGTQDGNVLLFNAIIPPTVNIGEDKTTKVGQKIEFQGIGKDENYKIVKYEWDFDGDGVYDYSNSTGFASWKYSKEGDYEVRLRVTNEKNGSSIDTLLVTVKKSDDDENNLLIFEICLILFVIFIIYLFFFYRKRK